MKKIKRSGIALIMAVGILAILAMVAIGFSVFARMELKSSTGYENQFQADCIAEAGISQTIWDLKYGAKGVKAELYDTPLDDWYYEGDGGSNPVADDLKTAATPSFGVPQAFGGGTYKLKVIDCASLVNINVPFPGSNPNVRNGLQAVLGGLLSSSSKATDILNYRQTLPNNKFISKEEMKLVSTVNDSDYNNIKDYITLYGGVDTGDYTLGQTLGAQPGHTEMCFINVNTAPAVVLDTVLDPIMSGSTATLISHIISRRNSNPFDGSNTGTDNFSSALGEWQWFLQNEEANGDISVGDLASLLDETNPNRYEPGVAVTPSTYFSFDSGGYYEIEAIGDYNGASKRITKAVHIYNKIYQTSKEDFDTKNDPLRTTRVTWKDSCPVTYGCLKKHIYDPTATDVELMLGSIKLGFWDDFDEDYDHSNPNDKGDWVTLQESFNIAVDPNDSNNWILRTWPIGGPGSFVQGRNYFPNVELDRDKWRVNGFSICVRLIDELDDVKAPAGWRTDLPWPNIPNGGNWGNDADTSTCPDPSRIKSGKYHERFMNVAHLKFGVNPMDCAGVYCSFPQEYDILPDGTDNVLYSQWVDYDGTGYIYFAPAPDPANPAIDVTLKPFSVLREPQLMVIFDSWWWPDSSPSGFRGSEEGTECKSMVSYGYQHDKTFCLSTKGPMNIDITVYFPGNSMSAKNPDIPNDWNGGFMAYPSYNDWENRIITMSGINSLFDMDNVRIIPEQGVYTAGNFDPTNTGGTLNMIEWGTLSSGVSLPQNANKDKERVFLHTNFFGLDTYALPGPGDVEPVSAGVYSPAGGSLGAGTYPVIRYRIYMFSDDDRVVASSYKFENTPVVEDVTITYMPQTKILAMNKN
ncbi:MAG: general secretion pathway protein GspK [PVC group bacterium]|nr:general secretion pathway protein GspK [PVC group bacterium]